MRFWNTWYKSEACENSFIHLSRCEVGGNPTKTVLKSNNKKLYNSATTHNTFMNCKDWSKTDLELENC